MSLSNEGSSVPPHRRHFMARQLRSRPRLAGCTLLALALGLVLPHDWRIATRILIGWNAGVWTYLALVAIMLARSSHESIRRRAEAQDEGRFVILVLTSLAAIASVGAIVAQLAATKDMTGLPKLLHVVLASSTIVSAFAFIHVTFALHYAHEFVLEARGRRGDGRGGLIFPGTESPGYLDFLYFAFVIGVAAQTADVSIASKSMRRVALIHCVLSFFFNTTILALTVNIAAGMF